MEMEAWVSSIYLEAKRISEIKKEVNIIVLGATFH